MLIVTQLWHALFDRCVAKTTNMPGRERGLFAKATQETNLLYTLLRTAAVVQLVERQPSKLIVAGSSPVRRSTSSQPGVQRPRALL